MSTKETKYCYFYIKQDENNNMTSQEISNLLQNGKIDDRVKALKSLILNIIHDDAFPRMLMTVFNFLVPIQNEHHDLKKVLLYYWEIVEKVNTDGKLKEEMILVCNSIRNDLLHPNEYIRGRTLRLLSRVPYKGILEPLAPSILENLSHKHSYVRRNAVSCLYMIYLQFRDDLIPDIDEHIEKLLINESDLSTKRNAFLLLYNSNQEKAILYINQNIIGERPDDDVGDLIQLAVLETLRKSCKLDPQQKPKLIKAISAFSNSKSNSVIFECANSLVQLTSNQTAMKMAIGIYVQLLTKNTDNNVKLIVLDKLIQLRHLNQKYLEDQIVEITTTLDNQSIDIRKKTLELVQSLVSSRNIQIVCPQLLKELQKILNVQDTTEIEYKNLLLENLKFYSLQYSSVTDQILHEICDHYLTQQKIDSTSSNIITSMLKELIQSENTNIQSYVINMLINKLSEISSQSLLKSSLYILGEFSQSQETIEKVFIALKKAIGPLPLKITEIKNQQKSENGEAVADKSKNSEENLNLQVKKNTRIKTVILPDGTYGTEIIEDILDEQDNKNDESSTKFRENLVNSGVFASILATSFLKLLFKLKDNKQIYNKYASDVLLILCSILKLNHLKQSQNKIDINNREKLTYVIKMILNPQQFTQQSMKQLEQDQKLQKSMKLKKQQCNSAATHQKKTNYVSKQPDDPIFIRQLKGKLLHDGDLSDDESNSDQVYQDQSKKSNIDDYTQRLSKTIQLTGYKDPIYAEAFVNIHKYDIQFEILLINQTNQLIQNVSVDFSTQGELRVVEKASQVTLGPKQSEIIKTNLKLQSSEAGLIFGSISYENRAGIAQGFMITNEIQIDIIDFIYPEYISLQLFRKLWQKYEWENRILINTNIKNPIEYIQHLQQNLKMMLLTNIDHIENTEFISANLYAKTKLDDDFLMNVSIENVGQKIQGYIRIRSKVKGIVINLGERIKKIQNQ